MLGIYIHIPFCNRICNYCDFCKILYDKKYTYKYLDNLEHEIKSRYNGEVVKTIYIGGGTPSSLDTLELDRLLSIIDIFKLDKNVFFAIYYTLGAIALTNTIGIDIKDIKKAINDTPLKSKRMETYKVNGRSFETIESKNENALSYLQSINYITSSPNVKTIIMGFENVSRRYKYNDLSWLYDVDYELLADDKTLDKIFLIGRFRYDVATRLYYANIPKEKIILVDDVNEIMSLVTEKSKGDIYSMVCFDMTEILTKLIKEASNEKNN